MTSTTIRLTFTNVGVVPGAGSIRYVDPGISGIAFGAIAVTAGTGTIAESGIFDPIANERFQTIVLLLGEPGKEEVEALLDPRFNATNQIMDGVAIVGGTSAASDLTTSLLGRNSQSMIFMVDRFVAESKHYGAAILEHVWVVYSYIAAIRALRLTPGASIGRIISSAAALDQFGGSAIASLPYFNTPFDLLRPPPTGKGFTDVEVEELFAVGGTAIGLSPGGTMVMGEAVTTYLTDPAGNDDATWQFLNSVDTASQAREYMHNNVKKRFSQTRFTTGAAHAGRDMANAGTIKLYLVKLYSDLAGPDFMLVQDGEEAIAHFLESIQISIDMAIGKATVTMKLPIITQLRIFQATVKIDFDITR